MSRSFAAFGVTRVARIRSVLFAAGLLACPMGALGQEYTVTDLGTLQPNNEGIAGARAISNTGAITGYSYINATAYHAFLIPAGGGPMIDLGFFNSSSFFSIGYAVNDAGQVAGAAQTQSTGFATALRAAPLVDLPELPGGGDSFGFGINSTGVIVGWSNQAQGCGGPFCTNNPGRATMWTGNGITILPALGGIGSLATGINDAGIICGYYNTNGNGDPHAMRITAALTEDLGTLGGPRSTANAINAAGLIVGAADLPGGTTRATLWSPGQTASLGSMDGKPVSEALDINNEAVAVGYSANANTSQPRATRFQLGSAPVDLNGLIPTDSGWLLQIAFSINDSGHIVGEGQLNGLTRAFLLTPIEVDPPCPVDFNSDGIVEPGDLDDFITAFFSDDADERARCDFNNDGIVEPGDLDEFITAFFDGC
ncbi:MAG: hypothetical protein ACT4PL_09125 [Phycisphaerales bacterium]